MTSTLALASIPKALFSSMDSLESCTANLVVPTFLSMVASLKCNGTKVVSETNKVRC